MICGKKKLFLDDTYFSGYFWRCNFHHYKRSRSFKVILYQCCSFAYNFLQKGDRAERISQRYPLVKTHHMLCTHWPFIPSVTWALLQVHVTLGQAWTLIVGVKQMYFLMSLDDGSLIVFEFRDIQVVFEFPFFLFLRSKVVQENHTAVTEMTWEVKR